MLTKNLYSILDDRQGLLRKVSRNKRRSWKMRYDPLKAKVWNGKTAADVMADINEILANSKNIFALIEGFDAD